MWISMSIVFVFFLVNKVVWIAAIVNYLKDSKKEEIVNKGILLTGWIIFVQLFAKNIEIFCFENVKLLSNLSLTK